MTSATVPLDVLRHRNNVTELGRADARPVLFVHGFGSGQEMWRLVVPAFLREHRVVLFDHVGSGNSDLGAYDRRKYDSLYGYADDLLQIVEALDLTDVVCVGHSVSAIIAMLAVTQDPSRFGALVLIGPSPRYTDTDGYRGGFDQDGINSLLDSIDANYLGWSRAMAPVLLAQAEESELTRELTDAFSRADPDITRHFARATFLSDHRRELAKVAVPTLVVQCKDDVIAPEHVGEYVHAAIPGSAMVTLGATGHWPVLSAPTQLAAEIQAFLR